MHHTIMHEHNIITSLSAVICSHWSQSPNTVDHHSLISTITYHISIFFIINTIINHYSPYKGRTIIFLEGVDEKFTGRNNFF